jgi:hypothetical protein
LIIIGSVSKGSFSFENGKCVEFPLIIKRPKLSWQINSIDLKNGNI